MLEIILFNMAVLAICLWIVFALELADYIQSKKKNNKQKNNQLLTSLMLNTSFTIAFVVFCKGVYFLLKIKGLISF